MNETSNQGTVSPGGFVLFCVTNIISLKECNILWNGISAAVGMFLNSDTLQNGTMKDRASFA